MSKHLPLLYSEVKAYVEAGGTGTSTEIGLRLGKHGDSVRKVLGRLREQQIATVIERRVTHYPNRPTSTADVWGPWVADDRPVMSIVESALLSRSALHEAWWPLPLNLQRQGAIA